MMQLLISLMAFGLQVANAQIPQLRQLNPFQYYHNLAQGHLEQTKWKVPEFPSIDNPILEQIMNWNPFFQDPLPDRVRYSSKSGGCSKRPDPPSTDDDDYYYDDEDENYRKLAPISGHPLPCGNHRQLLRKSLHHNSDFLSMDNKYYEGCKDEMFKINMFVDRNPHAYFLVSPVEESKKECLMNLLIHADFPVTNTINDANRRMKKFVHATGEDDKRVIKKMMKKEKFAPVGIFSLSKIAEAFHAADDGSDKPYDRHLNNCGVLLINMGSHLGIDYDSHPEIVNYIQQGLMDVMNEANNKPN